MSQVIIFFIVSIFNTHNIFQCTESAQEVVCVGSGAIQLGSLRIQQVACAKKIALLLSQDGLVYLLPYDNLIPQLVPGNCFVIYLLYYRVFGY